MNELPSSSRKTRRDGWTAARRAGFIAALGRMSIADAAASAGMSRQAAYRLRARDSAVAAAWRSDDFLDETMMDAAIDTGYASGIARLTRRFDHPGGDAALIRALGKYFKRKSPVFRELV